MAEVVQPTRVRVGPQGRVVIPAKLRESLGIDTGDTLILRQQDGRLILEKPELILERIHQTFSHIPPDVSLADELIAERRLEAQREAEE